MLERDGFLIGERVRPGRVLRAFDLADADSGEPLGRAYQTQRPLPRWLGRLLGERLGTGSWEIHEGPDDSLLFTLGPDRSRPGRLRVADADGGLVGYLTLCGPPPGVLHLRDRRDRPLARWLPSTDPNGETICRVVPTSSPTTPAGAERLWAIWHARAATSCLRLSLETGPERDPFTRMLVLAAAIAWLARTY